jgi:hypothetical protein
MTAELWSCFIYVAHLVRGGWLSVSVHEERRLNGWAGQNIGRTISMTSMHPSVRPSADRSLTLTSLLFVINKPKASKKLTDYRALDFSLLLKYGHTNIFFHKFLLLRDLIYGISWGCNVPRHLWRLEVCCTFYKNQHFTLF